MSNTILTPNIITKEALRILHEKLTFIGSIYRGYDDSFAKKGAKIGDTLKIRTPNEFTVRTGKTLNVQNVEEESIELKVNTQKGVDFKFDSSELTLKIDEFSERYLKPAMTRLAAAMEADALTMIKDIYQLSDQDSVAVTALTIGKAREILNHLKFVGRTFYEEKDSIGKRYRRMDALGTPYCITVDHQTLEDNTVTIRERDTMQQDRIHMDEVAKIVGAKIDMNNLLRKAVG